MEKLLQISIKNKSKLCMVILTIFEKFFCNLTLIRETFNSKSMIPSLLNNL